MQHGEERTVREGEKSCLHPDGQVLLLQLAYLNKSLFRKANRHFIASGVPMRLEQLPLIMALYSHGSLSQQELADETGRDKASVQRTVRFLEKHHYVTIRPDATDGRKNIVCLTEHGCVIVKQVINMAKRVDRLLFSVIGSQERGRLLAIINKITRRIGKDVS